MWPFHVNELTVNSSAVLSHLRRWKESVWSTAAHCQWCLQKTLTNTCTGVNEHCPVNLVLLLKCNDVWVEACSLFIQNWLCRSCRVITSIVGQASYTVRASRIQDISNHSSFQNNASMLSWTMFGSECHRSQLSSKFRCMLHNARIWKFTQGI